MLGRGGHGEPPVQGVSFVAGGAGFAIMDYKRAERS